MCYKGRAEGFHFRKQDYGNVATYSKFRTVGCRGLYNRNISARHYIAFSVSSAINHRKSCTQHQRKPVDKGTEKVINEWPTLGRKIDIKLCLFTLNRQKWDSSATNRSLRLLKQRSVCKEFHEAPYFIFCAWSAEPFHLLAAIDALSAHYSLCSNMVLSMWRYSLEKLLIHCQMGRVLSNYL
jgi:hypothetical protein